MADVRYLCTQLVTILHSSIRIYDKEERLRQRFGELTDEEDPLCCDQDFLKILMAKAIYGSPVLYSEMDKILYGILKAEDGKTYIAGPVSIVWPDRKLNEYVIKTHGITAKDGYRLTFCEQLTFGTGLLILNQQLSGRELLAADLWKENGINKELMISTGETLSKVVFERRELEIAHNPYSQEVREMDSIRLGDCDRLRKSIGETYQGEIGKLSENKVRQSKNIAICVLTLASRAAIEGGLLPELSYSMVDGYILKIENMSNTIEIEALMREAEFDFATRVHNINQNTAKNQLVEQAKNYIFKNLHRRFQISEIGKSIGINTDYLSGLFHKAEGITLQNYVMQERIYLSKNLLCYSKYGIQEIADYLAFCSQSHFGSSFKKVTGMTPQQYRRNMNINRN